MADAKFNIKKAIEDSAQVSDLASLAGSGVKRVKVLDERALQEMIERAVDAAISSSTQEERSRILADSRKQLTKLMNERDQFISRADMAEASKNDLMGQIEKLQNELKLLREVKEQDAALQSQIAELEERERALQKKTQELLGENAWLRENNDKMVDQLDQAQQEVNRLQAGGEELEQARQEIERLKEEIERLNAEIERLKAEIERLRSQSQSDENELQRRLEAAEAEAAGLRERLSSGDALANELNSACEENDQLKAKLAEGERWYQELSEAKKDNDRLQQELDEIQRSKANAAAAGKQQVEALQAEVERLKAAVPERIPIVVLPNEEEPKAPAEPAEPPPPPKPVFTGKPGKGLDIGTVNLVSSEMNNENEIELRLQRNVFIDVEITPYTKAMLTKLEVGYVVQNKRMYILGEPAFKLANVLNRATRRPMADGLISPKEQDALPIMKLLIGRSSANRGRRRRSASTPSPASRSTAICPVAYHRDLFDAVLKSLGYKPSHILEGHAVTFAGAGAGGLHRHRRLLRRRHVQRLRRLQVDARPSRSRRRAAATGWTATSPGARHQAREGGDDEGERAST
jgi:predicted  nucleic acid-binding Zn-ribbon protein